MTSNPKIKSKKIVHGVVDVKNFRVWALNDKNIVASVELVVNDSRDVFAILVEARLLFGQHRIANVTIEPKKLL